MSNWWFQNKYLFVLDLLTNPRPVITAMKINFWVKNAIRVPQTNFSEKQFLSCFLPASEVRKKKRELNDTYTINNHSRSCHEHMRHSPTYASRESHTPRCTLIIMHPFLLFASQSMLRHQKESMKQKQFVYDQIDIYNWQHTEVCNLSQQVQIPLRTTIGSSPDGGGKRIKGGNPSGEASRDKSSESL